MFVTCYTLKVCKGDYARTRASDINPIPADVMHGSEEKKIYVKRVAI